VASWEHARHNANKAAVNVDGGPGTERFRQMEPIIIMCLLIILAELLRRLLGEA
jgi:hypothetical protein